MDYPLLAVAGLLLVLFLFRRKAHKPLAFPGPKGLPFLGAYFEMRGKETHKMLAKWAHRYGPAFKFSLYGQEYLVVNHPDTLTEVLVTRGKSYGGRFKSYQSQEITNNFQNLVNTSNMALNATLRKAVHRCIQSFGTERTQLATTLTSSVQLLLDSFQMTNSQAFDPTDSIYKATSLTVFLLICGEELGDTDSLSQAIKRLDEANNAVASQSLDNLLLNAVPWLRYIPGFPPYQHVLEYKKHMDNIYECIVLPALEKSDDSGDRTIGKALLNVVGQKYGEGDESGEITMENVKLTMIDFIVAGTITTSASFSSLIHILQHHPEIQEKAHKEINEQIGSHRIIEFADKERLPYCRAIVLEQQRLAPVVPLGLGHVTKEDVLLGGIDVPRGTHVITNLWSCHHDPELWAEPWTFRPERFLDDNGHLVPADHTNRKQLFPFGAGTRVCVGQVLALNRLFVFLANCLQKFQFLLPDGADSGLCDVRNFQYSTQLLWNHLLFLSKLFLDNRQRRRQFNTTFFAFFKMFTH